MTITRLGLKPGRTLNRSQKLCKSKLAATMSTKESANSPITRNWRARERSLDPLEPRPSCRSVPIKSVRLMSHAGASPQIVPAATETATANPSTPHPTPMSFKCGRLAGTQVAAGNAGRRRRMAKPRRIPPSRNSRRISVSSARMRRGRCAPNARRTVISRPRALALASSRLATLTQLMRRTKPTAPNY